MKRQVVVSVTQVTFGDYVYQGELTTEHHSEIPFLNWPDGRPCNEANLYVLEMLRRGMATGNGGGSVRQYAYAICQLIKYCYENRIGIRELSDARFVQFVGRLRAPRPDRNGRATTQSVVIANGRVVLDFLAYLDQLFGGDRLVGSGGRIRATKSVALEPSSRGAKIRREYWDHAALGSPSPKRRRSPISRKTIDELYAAAASCSKVNFVVRRRQLLLRALEISGARIGEVAKLKTLDIVQAAKSKMRLIRFETLKRGQPHSRELPFLQQDLDDFVSHIEIHRRSIVRRKLGVGKDHGFLFVSQKTGQPMSADALSNEIGLLRRHAGISEAASAHLFRHRFITRLFIHLIEEHQFANTAELRTALLEIESFKRVIVEWTGHAELASLDSYIDLAFDEWKGISKTRKAVSDRRAREAFSVSIDRLIERLGQEITPVEFKAAYIRIKENLDVDLQSQRESELGAIESYELGPGRLRRSFRT